MKWHPSAGRAARPSGGDNGRGHAAARLVKASLPQTLEGARLLWPTEDAIARLALAAAGSAPGAGGIPCELSHVGTDLVAPLLPQAFTPEATDTQIEAALGPQRGVGDMDPQ